MLVGDLLAAIDAAVPFGGAEDWDPIGLQLGDVDRRVGAVAVCHEVTEALVDSVTRDGIDTIVAYHPLLFTPTTSFTAGRTPTGRALRLAEDRVALIVVHTAFDAVVPGTGDALAAALGLEAVGVFGAFGDAPGIGRVCRPSRPMDASELGELVGRTLGVVPRIADAGGAIETIAVVPGSGSSAIEQASQLADALITGDVSHHRARAGTDAGLTILDAGHAATERPGIEALYSLVDGIVGGATMLDDDPTPWKD